MDALLIDDSRATRMFVRHLLRQAGFQVVEASDGREGLAQLSRLRAAGKHPVVLVDWNMPEMDGLAFIRAARADSANRDLCMIVATGEEDAAQETVARQAGASDVVRKPFTQETLVMTLAQLGIELS